MKHNWMKKGLVVPVILLFIGVAVAPSINVVVAKEAARNKCVVSIVGSKELFDSVNTKLVSAPNRDGPWMWLFFKILEILSSILKTINYVIDLIKEGKLLSETFRGFCFILLAILLIPAVIRTYIQDFLPRDFEDTILYYILGWLGSIVFPDNPLLINNFHLFVKNIISVGVSKE